MLEKIYEVIKNNKSVTFEEVHQQFSRQIRSRKDFSGYLKNLEESNKIMFYGQRYYDLTQFPKVQGVVHWNLTGFCWLENEDHSNDYGIAFDSRDDLNLVWNKRRAYLGHEAVGRQVTLDEKSFVYIEEARPIKDVKLIAVHKAKQNRWTVLNSSMMAEFDIYNEYVRQIDPSAVKDVLTEASLAGTSIKYENIVQNGLSKASTDPKVVDTILNAIPNDEIVEFVYHKEGFISLSKHYGNLNTYGMETKIIKALSEIENAPVNTNEVKTEKLKVSPYPFYTIDGISTRDIDDAIYIEKTEQGWKLQVAIADVSSFVQTNDAQDSHAQKNSISYYFPHEVVNLLDRKLAEEHCSLNPGTPKQSMICIVDLNAEGKILSYDFQHREIVSHARLTYDDVDTLIEGGKPSESKFFNGTELEDLKSFDQIPQIKESLIQLNAFAKTQKFGRERDYFVVETPEYDLNSFGKIDKMYFRDENKPSQKMVENSMLVANVCAAKFIAENFDGIGMFRNQVPPEEGEFPKAAVYQSENVGHWGLDLSHYTHFTSPIRRYCDLVNHRLIKDVIYHKAATYSKEEIDSIASQINKRQYIEKQISNKSKQMLLPQYIQALQQTGSLDNNVTVIDFSKTGVVLRNSQLIEFFIPTFKLSNELKEDVLNFSINEEISMNEKIALINTLNDKYQLDISMGKFYWTDEKKDIAINVTPKNSNTPSPQ